MFAKLISTIHSAQSTAFVQTLVQVEIKLFQVGIMLSAWVICNFFESGDT